MKTFLLLFWALPAVFMTLWTMLTAVLAWTLPLRKSVPTIIAGHILLAIYNPKDDYLYQRPSVPTVLAILAIGLVPLVSLLLLAFHAFLVWTYQSEQCRQRRKRASALT
ncbi:hypothetical protein [Burkholderia cenocepacia]|uniref:hypothetical protein n=1 Tax=Burkholderia cenocepacia TaxID=95486 RepID=UPI0007613878|nr:hypothetical protein [Burkholderia cenocepacia]KWU26388.1 hypothetical protein AS149_25705 [Burkholderia cenocepacia]